MDADSPLVAVRELCHLPRRACRPLTRDHGVSAAMHRFQQLRPLLNVADTERALGFYGDVLGFEVLDRHPEHGRPVWAALKAGPVQIMLNQPDHAVRVGRVADASYSDVVLYFAVDDARSLHRRLEQLGIPTSPVEHMDYGVWEFTLRDPDGYELAFGSFD